MSLFSESIVSLLHRAGVIKATVERPEKRLFFVHLFIIKKQILIENGVHNIPSASP